MPMERDGTRERPSYVKQSSLVLIYVCFWYFLNLQLHIIIFWFLWSPQLFPIEITFQCPLLASLQIAKALPNGIRPGSPGPGRGHETEPTRCSWASPKFTNGSPYFLRSGMGGKWCMGLCWLRWILCLPEGVQKSLYPRRMEAILSKGASRECCCTSPLRDPVQMVTVLKESIGNLLILYICSSTKIKESTCFEKKSRVWILR